MPKGARQSGSAEQRDKAPKRPTDDATIPVGAGSSKATSAMSHLNWRAAAVDLANEIADDGFGMLEEIPAGSYELVKQPGGGYTIVMKGASGAAEKRDKKLKKTAVTDGESAAADNKPPAAGSSDADDVGQKRKRQATAERQHADSDDSASDSDDEGDEAEVDDVSEQGEEATDEDGDDVVDEDHESESDEAAVAERKLPKHIRIKGEHGPVAPNAGIDIAAVASEWATLGVTSPILLQNIATLGYSTPTRIQQQAVPASLQHFKDVVGAAATGSGKTAAYAVPIVHRLLDRRERLGMGTVQAGQSVPIIATTAEGIVVSGYHVPVPADNDGSEGAAVAAVAAKGRARAASSAPVGTAAALAASTYKSWSVLPALILCPTRELAVQVTAHISAICKGTLIKAVTVVGGLAPEKQERLLRSHPDIIVATPGRFWDLVSSGRHPYLQQLWRLQFLVMDEADRLVEKGSFPHVNNILAAMRPPPPGSAGAGATSAKSGADGAFHDPEAERILAEKRKAQQLLLQKGNVAASNIKNLADEAAADDSDDEEDADDDEDDADMDQAEDEEGSDGDDDEDDEADGDDAAEDDEASDADEEAAAPAGPLVKKKHRHIPAEYLVDPPAHYKRQSFLFSATLGVATQQSIKDAATALAQASVSIQTAGGASADGSGKGAKGGAAGSGKASKKVLRRALARASQLTPVEALMARVGMLGKPELIQVARPKKPSADDDADGGSKQKKSTSKGAAAGAVDGDDEEDGAWDKSAGSIISLPDTLRLARITCPEVQDKDAHLYSFLLQYAGRALIFVNAISTLKRLASVLLALKLSVHPLHAHMQQRQRLHHLERFRKDSSGILLATDVAARGLDVPQVDFVIHYSLPPTAETFVHRCGRTARGTSAGLALALVGPKDHSSYGRIMGVLGLTAGLPEFPDDSRVTKKVVPRVSLARKIADAQASLNRESEQQHWLTTTAAEAGIEVDDDTAAEVGAGRADLALASQKLEAKQQQQKQQQQPKKKQERSSKKQKRSNNGDDDAGGSVASAESGGIFGEFDEDTRAEAHATAKKARVELKNMRNEMEYLLQQDVMPAAGVGSGYGVSRRYITSNPLLKQASHPLQDLVQIHGVGFSGAMDGEDEDGDDKQSGSGGEADEEMDDGSKATAATALSQKKGKNSRSASSSSSSAAPAAPVVRTGALVAPRVTLPVHLMSGSSRNGGRPMPASAAIASVGASTSAAAKKAASNATPQPLTNSQGQSEALKQLAKKGKHVHVPGVSTAKMKRQLKAQERKKNKQDRRDKKYGSKNRGFER